VIADSEAERSLNREVLHVARAPARDGHVVGGVGHNWRDVERQRVGPTAGEDHIRIREALIVGKDAEEVALEANVVKLCRLDPNTTQGEVGSAVDLWWVGLAVGLGRVQDEVAEGIDLLEGHGVGHGRVVNRLGGSGGFNELRSDHQLNQLLR
jgi:hypothetical protein